MEKRVLFTGNGNLVVDDLMKRMPNEYYGTSCPAASAQFLEGLSHICPQTVVICLLNESRENLRMYHVLGTDPKYKDLPVIIIGTEEDCSYFRQHISIKDLRVICHPVSMEKFLQALDSCTFLQQPGGAPAPDSPAAMEEKLEKIAVLQLEAAAAVPARKALQKSALDRLGDRQTILVVDDDTRILNIIKLYLQELFDVVIVPSGKLALKYLSRHSADLVLLDYMMPVEDGPAILRQIRCNSPYPHIPVLFLTGVSDKDMVMKSLEYHPDGYCLKPVTQDALIERITAILLGP